MIAPQSSAPLPSVTHPGLVRGPGASNPQAQLSATRWALHASKQQLAQARADEAQLRAGEQRVLAMLLEFQRRQALAKLPDSPEQRAIVEELQRLHEQSKRVTGAARMRCEALARSVAQARDELNQAEDSLARMRQRDRAVPACSEPVRVDESVALPSCWRPA